MKGLLRLAGIALGVLVALLGLMVGILYLVGSSRISETHEVATVDLRIPADDSAVARGAHLARIHGCTDCHAGNLQGKLIVDAPPFRVVAPNLTRGAGGVGSQHDANSLDAAIRHGVGRDGRALVIMPSGAFHRLGDYDAAALIAYLQQVPPVDNVLPGTEFKPLGRILAAFALDPDMEVNTGAPRREAPAPAPTTEYGAYLASITCAYCHGPQLEGAQPANPGSPPAPALAPAGRWTSEEFEHALRTGMTPGGRRLDPAFMPWTFTANMSDDEIAALHAYFATLTPQG